MKKWTNTPTTTEPGTVLAFDPISGKGTVRSNQTYEELVFDEVAFRSGRPIRHARVGEPVDLIFSAGKLICVRVP